MSQIKERPKKFIYKANVKWLGEKRGLLSSSGKPDIDVATPPEFKGHPGFWTPEDLFTASINSCVMTTFLHYVERKSLGLLGYESEAESVLEKIENKFIISEVNLRVRITVKENTDIQNAKDIINLSKENCLISNSVRSKVNLFLEIKIASYSP